MKAPYKLRTWHLRKPDFNEADIIWCKTWSDRVTLVNDIWMQAQTGNHFGKNDIAIETTSVEQESMLKLKYGDDMLLLMEEYILTDMIPCTLTGIDF